MPSIKELAIPAIVGCLLTCILNILINRFTYGKTVVKLDKNIDNYENEIDIKEVSDINMTQHLKWSIIPSILNLLVWAGIIWYITKPKSGSGSESDNGSDTSSL